MSGYGQVNLYRPGTIKKIAWPTVSGLTATLVDAKPNTRMKLLAWDLNSNVAQSGMRFYDGTTYLSGHHRAAALENWRGDRAYTTGINKPLKLVFSASGMINGDIWYEEEEYVQKQTVNIKSRYWRNPVKP